MGTCVLIIMCFLAFSIVNYVTCIPLELEEDFLLNLQENRSENSDDKMTPETNNPKGRIFNSCTECSIIEIGFGRNIINNITIKLLGSYLEDTQDTSDIEDGMTPEIYGGLIPESNCHKCKIINIGFGQDITNNIRIT